MRGMHPPTSAWRIFFSIQNTAGANQLLLCVLHVVAGDNVRDCVFLKDDLYRVKKGLNSYELKLFVTNYFTKYLLY